MKVAIYERFKGPIEVRTVPDPRPSADGVVVRVQANGVCRSDWHGWMGHDSDVVPPHVPGHEMAGVVAEVGASVRRWRAGDRVTVPFVAGCGHCPQCRAGHHQVCDHQFQIGFTGWGSFAEYVAVDYADTNLVRIPDPIDFIAAASLGCRFTTAFRAVVDQARVAAGEWLVVHGCGGVGLSAIMIANAIGANVIGVDLRAEALREAERAGAASTIDAARVADVPAAVAELTAGGAHASIDAFGHPSTCRNSVLCLRTHGRHVQVGLFATEQRECPVPMARVLAKELEIYGSHGIAAHRFPALFSMIRAGKLTPGELVQQVVTLEDGARILTDMDRAPPTGIAVIAFGS